MRLRRLVVGGPVRRAAEKFRLRRLSLPIPPAVGGDESQVAGTESLGSAHRSQYE